MREFLVDVLNLYEKPRGKKFIPRMKSNKRGYANSPAELNSKRIESVASTFSGYPLGRVITLEFGATSLLSKLYGALISKV